MPETHLDFLKLRHFHRLEACSTQVIFTSFTSFPGSTWERHFQVLPEE